jgi:phage protein D
MGNPKDRAFGDDLAPSFELYVNDLRVEDDITRFVESVTFESALDMADVLEVKLFNPGITGEVDPLTRQPPPEFSSHKVFQPGNELELRAGYGEATSFIGRALISKHLPDFPEDGMPMLALKGYDKSQLMMDISGPMQATKENKAKLVTPRPIDLSDDQGVPYLNKRASDVVAEIADKYGFDKDIDETEKVLRSDSGDGIVQKKGMKDYELVKILANLNRREFFVDYNPASKNWVLHWKESGEKQTAGLVFRYGSGKQTTLLSFSAEYGVRDQITELVVLAWDDKQQRWVSVLLLEDQAGPDPMWRQGGNRMERQNPVAIKKTTTRSEFDTSAKKKGHSTSTKAQKERAKEAVSLRNSIDHELSSATQFRLAAAGVAIDIKSDRPFSSLQEASEFAQRWFEAKKNNFLVGTGKVVGVESLRARQVHRLEGLGPRLSGDWYFINVRHTWNKESGYSCEFTARKVLD